MLKEFAVAVATNPSMFTIDEVVEVLSFTGDQYYNNTADEGESFLEDPVWDHLYRYLEITDPVNKYLIGVGADVRGDKIPLPYPMPGLDQNHEGDTVKWIKDNKLGNEEFVGADKLDGNSGMIVYDTDGALQIAFSRGRDDSGQDLTRHFLRMKNVPKTNVAVDLDGSFVTRVEVEMKDEVFDKLNAQGLCRSRSGKNAKNARNYVAGQLNSSEADQVFYDNVDVVAYEVMHPKLDSKADEFKQLTAEGFTCAGFVLLVGNQITDDSLTALLAGRHDASPWALDGIVLTVNTKTAQESLPLRKGSNPNPIHSRKFKVGQEDNIAQATVVAVHYNPSKDGYLKPRVEIQPVDLVGVTITYATGFNAKFIKDNDIGVGAVITITRSGDVIPDITSVVTAAPNGPTLPDPTVFGTWSWSDNYVDAILDDPDNNREVRLQRLIYSANVLGVENMAGSALEKLFEKGHERIEDIIVMDADDVYSIVGSRNAYKGMDSLTKALNPIKVETLAAASNAYARGMGRRRLKKIMEAHGTVFGLSTKEIIEVDSFSDITAQQVVDGEYDFKLFLSKIDGFYSFDETKPAEVNTEGDFAGMVVVPTGVRFKDETKDKLLTLGIEVGGSVGKKTTHVVAKDPTKLTGKVKKAHDMGLTIMSLEEFEGMIQ